MGCRVSKELLAKLAGVSTENAKRIREALAQDSNRSSNANVECSTKHSGKGVGELPTVRSYSSKPCKEDGALPYIQGPVAIRIIHYRHTLADSEGYCIKFAIDALVIGGILEDDSAKIIPQRPIELHYKIPKEEKEKTEIEIWQTGLYPANSVDIQVRPRVESRPNANA